MNNAVAYVRVSSEGQGEDGYSLDDQLQKIKAYAIANQMSLENKNIFKDIESGSNPNRVGLNALIKATSDENNKINYVLVYAIDRWTRDAVNGLILLKEFSKKNIKLVSVSESFDPTTPIGRFMCGFLHQLAELNKETIIDKLSSGKKQMIQQTGKWGGGITPYGYSAIGKRKKRNEESIVNGRGQLVVNEQESIIVKTIFSLREKNKTYDQIIAYLTQKKYYNRNGRVFNKATIYRILNRKDMYTSQKHINSSIVLDKRIQPQQPRIFNA